jgi:hypothetical protein
MKLRALIGVTLSSLVLCSAAHAAVVVPPPNQVPEPESWTLAVMALGAMAVVLRRKSRSK